MFGFRIKIFTADVLISIYPLNMYDLYMHEHGPICIIKWVSYQRNFFFKKKENITNP